jgi:hypothetical protein
MLGPQWRQTSPPVTLQVFIADVPSHMLAPSTQSSWQPRPQVPPPQIGLSAGHAVGAPQAGHRSAPGPQVSTLLPLHRCAPRSQTCGQLASGWLASGWTVVL